MAMNRYSEESLHSHSQLPAGYDEDPNEITISFRNVYRALLHKFWIMILTAVLGAGAMVAVVKFILPPAYTIKSIIYLQPDEVLVDDNGKIGTFDKKIINNAMYIVENETLLNSLTDISGYETSEEVRKNLDLLAYGEADMLEVNITGATPEEAYDLSVAFLDGAVQLLEQDIPYANVSIIQEPVKPERPSNGSTLLFAVIGGLIGLILGFVGLMVYGLRDTRMTTKEEAEDFFGKPVYAVLPETKGRD